MMPFSDAANNILFFLLLSANEKRYKNGLLLFAFAFMGRLKIYFAILKQIGYVRFSPAR